MGQKKTETTNTIPSAGGRERSLQARLAQIFSDAEGQLGDLSSLAAGDLSQLGPTGQDRQLVRESIGAAGDIARRELQTLGAEGQAGLDETLAARGIQGSSIESVDRSILSRNLQNQLATLIDKQRIEGSQQLLNLPFQRAQTTLGANQALFNRITGPASPVLQGLLQERLAQGSQTSTETGLSTGEALGSGVGIGTSLIAAGAS